MNKGSRCKETKPRSAIRQHATVLALLVACWAGGWLMTRLDIPVAVQIFFPALLALLAISKQHKTTQHPTQTTPTSIETAEIPFDNSTSSSFDQNFAGQALSKSHKYQLNLLCTTLGLTSATVILHNQETDSCFLHSIHSNTPDSVNRRVEQCTGVLLSLKNDRAEITGHPTSPAFQGLPYYKDGTMVGGFMAIALRGIDQHHPLKTAGFFCVDRLDSTPWTDEEKIHIRNSAKKINTDLYVAEQLSKSHRDHKATNQICLALQDLNTVLNLKEAFRATQKAVTDLTPATVVAITLKGPSGHTVVSVRGQDDLQDLAITGETCLVNQAMLLKRTMVPKGSLTNPVALFTSASPIDSFGSLFVIPLIINEQTIGTLIIGGKPPHVFTANQQTLLEVIASQIATRIDLARTHEEVHRLATIDGLTGLVNHRTFQNGLAKILDRASRQQSDVALILCDIDHFKMVNDTYGHPFGDEVLRRVAKTLKEAVRNVDLAARYGGEEFTLVLENATAEGGQKFAERIRQEVEALRFEHEGQEVRVTMSFGISSFPKLSSTKAELISQADQALYQCKEGGRNQTRCYEA